MANIGDPEKIITIEPIKVPEPVKEPVPVGRSFQNHTTCSDCGGVLAAGEWSMVMHYCEPLDALVVHTRKITPVR